MKSKLGLVLEGGGAKGSYHLGAYKALAEIGYKFNGIAGTSIGALNGALIAQGDWKKAYDLWSNISNGKIYGINEEAFNSLKRGDFSSENIEYAATVIGNIIKSKGIDTDNMKDLFFSILNEKKLRKSKIDLGVVTVKLPEFKTVEVFKKDIPKGEIHSYLMASANFPLFKRESNSQGNFIDGGIINNLPLNMLPSKGINELIAVRTFGVGVTKQYKNDSVDVTYIEPSKDLGATLDFDRETARRNLSLGYYDTYRTIKGYKGREFCIKPLSEDFSYINGLINTADSRILEAARVMGYKKINPKRFMFEKLLPQVADFLEIGDDISYEELILSFFEEVAKVLPVDKNRIYTADEFIREVRNQYDKSTENRNKFDIMPKIIQSSPFLSSFVKSDFYNFIMDIFFK